MRKILLVLTVLLLVAAVAFPVNPIKSRWLGGSLIYYPSSQSGNEYHVDSGLSSASDNNTGLDWETALATIDGAVGKCTADNGDTIWVAPGHTETFDASDEADIDVAGVSVIGLGTGELRPLLDYTNAAGEVVIGADDVVFKNFRCHANVTAVLTAINIEAGCENSVVEDCTFTVETAGTDEFIDTITVAGTGSDGTVIKNCLFDQGASSNAGPQSAINFVDSDNMQIIGNQFFGDQAVACIENETTASNYIVIKDNIIFNGIIGGNAGLNTEPGIELVATTTGVIANNYIVCNLATKAASVVGADMYLFENYYNEDEGGAATGGLIGTASADD